MIEWLADNQWVVYIAVFYLAFKMGWAFHETWILYVIQEHPERIEKAAELSRKIKQLNELETDQLLEQIKSGKTDHSSSAVEMTIERVGTMLYAYAKDSGQFLAQGPDLAAVLKNVELRYPGKKFFGEIAKDNPAKELA